MNFIFKKNLYNDFLQITNNKQIYINLIKTIDFRHKSKNVQFI